MKVPHKIYTEATSRARELRKKATESERFYGKFSEIKRLLVPSFTGSDRFIIQLMIKFSFL